MMTDARRANLGQAAFATTRTPLAPANCRLREPSLPAGRCGRRGVRRAARAATAAGLLARQHRLERRELAHRRGAQRRRAAVAAARGLLDLAAHAPRARQQRRCLAVLAERAGRVRDLDERRRELELRRGARAPRRQRAAAALPQLERLAVAALGRRQLLREVGQVAQPVGGAAAAAREAASGSRKAACAAHRGAGLHSPPPRRTC